MPPTIMYRGPIARLSASALSSHDVSSAAFTINIAESNFFGTHNQSMSY